MGRAIYPLIYGLDDGYYTALDVRMAEIDGLAVTEDGTYFFIHNLQQIVGQSHVEYKIYMVQVFMLAIRGIVLPGEQLDQDILAYAIVLVLNFLWNYPLAFIIEVVINFLRV